MTVTDRVTDKDTAELAIGSDDTRELRLSEACGHQAELPIGSDHNGADTFANEFRTRAWMLCDGGSIFRTGPDVGRAGDYYEAEQGWDDGWSAKVTAAATGFEMLTEQVPHLLPSGPFSLSLSPCPPLSPALFRWMRWLAPCVCVCV